jgi:hypothetical protein
MARQTLSPADALREAARQLEHQAEFNMSRTVRWSAARQAENNRLISQSRELHDRADALEPHSNVGYTSTRYADEMPEADFYGEG